MEEYEPGVLPNYPHILFRCQCGEQKVVVGHEVVGPICNECDKLMEWDADLHIPDVQ